MAGQGKYTRYKPIEGPLKSDGGNSPPNLGSVSYALLNTLFKTPETLTSAADIHKRANRYLCPVSQDIADPEIFPKGVYLNFQNPDPELSSPDIPNGPFLPQGKTIGGPSNAYVPNLASPDPSGAGSTDPIEPTPLTFEDIKPTIQIGVNGTVIPKVTSNEMYNGNILPSSINLGSRPGGQ